MLSIEIEFPKNPSTTPTKLLTFHGICVLCLQFMISLFFYVHIRVCVCVCVL